MKALCVLLTLSFLLSACAGSGVNTDDYPEFVEGAKRPTFEMAELMRNLTYPAQARELEIATSAVVQAKINEKGEVVEVVVVRTNSVPLGEALVDAVRKTTFMPAMYDGKPIRMRVFIPITINVSD